MIPYEPTKIDRPFAYNGARNDIPVDGGTETGNASLDLGFPPITSQPLSQGGIPPQRKDFNGVLYELSSHTHFQQSGGTYSWDETLDYISNCIVTHDGQIYICLATNGANTSAGVVTPGTNSTYWQSLYSYLQSSDTSDVGSGTQPVYVAGGKLVASTASVGGTAQPVRLSNGVITALTATVGADDTPVYLKSGVLTACSLSGFGISDYKFANPGYVKFDCGFIVQWGTMTTSVSGTYTLTFPIAFSSATSYAIMKNISNNSGAETKDRYQSFYSLTATTATTYCTYSGHAQWLAIGY